MRTVYENHLLGLRRTRRIDYCPVLWESLAIHSLYTLQLDPSLVMEGVIQQQTPAGFADFQIISKSFRSTLWDSEGEVAV